MNTPPEIVRRVQDLLRSSVALDVPTPDTDLISTGLLDSLSLVNVLLALDQEFGVQVVLEDIQVETFRSVRNIASYVSLKLGERGAEVASKL